MGHQPSTGQWVKSNQYAGQSLVPPDVVCYRRHLSVFATTLVFLLNPPMSLTLNEKRQLQNENNENEENGEAQRSVKKAADHDYSFGREQRDWNLVWTDAAP